jgi:hypothetical protein
MAAPVVGAGGAALESASGTIAGGSAVGAGSFAGSPGPVQGVIGVGSGGEDRDSTLGWLLGGLALAVTMVIMLPILVVAGIFPAIEGASNVEQIGAGSPVPAGYIPVFNAAASAVDVNPYLLASVAEQESGFSSEGVNSSGCAGFMQIGIGGECGDTWDSTVTLTGSPTVTVVVHSAWTLGVRPATYTGQTATHPNYNDPFDATIAAAVWLRHKVAGRPIPLLDNTAYEAACGYYGACANAVANYAQTVINRARLWESESALRPAAPEASSLAATPGTRLAELIEVANEVTAMRIPYCYGGGHAAVPGPSPGMYCHTITNSFIFHDTEPGLDCSGAVRWLLVSVGYPDPGGIDSGEMGNWLAPGPGRYVNVYYNDEHVFLTIEGHPWGTSDFNYRGGPAWIMSPSPYSTAGYQVAHPSGL